MSRRLSSLPPASSRDAAQTSSHAIIHLRLFASGSDNKRGNSVAAAPVNPPPQWLNLHLFHAPWAGRSATSFLPIGPTAPSGLRGSVRFLQITCLIAVRCKFHNKPVRKYALGTRSIRYSTMCRCPGCTVVGGGYSGGFSQRRATGDDGISGALSRI